MPTAIEFIADRLPRVTVEDVRRFADTVEIRDAAHILHGDTRQTVGNEFNGGGHGHLPGRFETGLTLVAFVAFVNFDA